MVDISQLNSPQRKAVTTIDGPVMLLAGAGTGKTRVITYRIAHMLDQGLDPTTIVALTFTNKAAREMKSRLQEIVGSVAKEVFLGTFHSYCLRLLRRYAKEANLSGNFGLAGTSDQLDFVRKAIEEHGWGAFINQNNAHAKISSAKNQLVDPDELGNQASDGSDEHTMLGQVYKTYERQLKLNRVIDFDDCIFKTVRLLERSEEVRNEVSARHQRFLVDEFQDTNMSQLRVLELLNERNRHLCVVGDDDQSIYSWRGAMPETLHSFERIFPEAIQITLDQNYRCTNIVLNGANQVIANNKKRKPKNLWSDSKGQEKITLSLPTDESAEARFVAQKILSWRGRGLKYEEIGVLYRANNQARAIELALREHRVPYKVFGGQSLFEKKEIKDVLSYLRLIGNPNDRLAFWRVINLPARGIGLKSLESIEQSSLANKCSPFAVIERDLVKLPSRAQTAAKEFCTKIRKNYRKSFEAPEQMAAFARNIIKDFGLEAEARLKSSSQQQSQSRVETLRHLPGWLENMATNISEGGPFEWKDFLDAVCLGEDPKRDSKEQIPSVSLMTIHSAKGLEFPLVFLVGVEEELLPHKNSVEEGNVDEERRLFYVAMTRAKTKLYLSHCHERQVARQKAFRKPSRFIDEIPKDLVDTEGEESAQTALDTKARQADTKKRLSSLRSMIKTGFQNGPP